MDQLVIVLNARLDSAGGAEGEPKSEGAKSFFRDAGDGGFETSFAFLTQPLGVASASSPAPEGDPLVLYRRFPEEWVFARKPLIGPPRTLLTRDAADGRPSTDELRAAVEKSDEGGLLGGIF